MKFTENRKRFWTLDRHHAAGFTLVELIVVIAILAILAGVAIPAYSGYVKKAERAGDEQLLAAVNTAFAAACAANGTDNYNVAEIPTFDVDTMELTHAYKDDFDTFFEGGTFKVITELVYMPRKGAFVEGGAMTFSFGTYTITLSASDVAILSGDNAFSDRGSAALLDDVSVLENLLDTGIGEDVLDAVLATDGFTYALGGYLGLTQGADEDYETYATRVESALDALDDADSALYSAQIMYAASNAANATSEQISTLFTNPDKAVTSSIEVKNADGTTDYTATMANAALAYGMYTAYVQQYGVDTTTNEGNFTNVVNSDAFATYYASSQGQADLEAYMAAMNMISDNTGNSEITSSILANGIDGNTDLEALMKEVMGS